MQTRVTFAVMCEPHSPGFLPFDLEAGEALPVDATETLFIPDDKYMLMKRDCIGIYSFGVPREKCSIVMRTVKSKFDVGQIVKKVGRDCVFRIYAVRWERTHFWYQDGWGESQNFSSGAFENELVIALDDDIEKNAWSIKYYDDLMEKRTRLFQTLPFDSKVNQ